MLPILDQAVDCVKESMLWFRVEEANQIVVSCMEGDVGGDVVEACVEVLP